MENYFTAPGMNCPSSATLLPGLLPFLPKSWSFFHIWKFYDGGYCFCSRCLILIDNVSPPSKFLFITYDHGERNVTPVTERCDWLSWGDAGLWLAPMLTPGPPGPRSQWSEASPLSRCHDDSWGWSLVTLDGPMVRMTDIAMLVINALKQRNWRC